MSKLWRPFSIPGVKAQKQIDRGNGVISYDQDRSYIDAASGLWNVSMGQANQALISEIIKQYNELTYASLFESTHGVAELLAQTIIEFCGGNFEHVYISTSGSTAVEVALRVSRLHFRSQEKLKKRKIVSFDLGYHGVSYLSLSASGILSESIINSDEMLPDFLHVPSPVNEEDSLLAIVKLFNSESEKIAAFIIEPILGSGGIIVPSREYCESINRLCLENDILLICDEVATGGGRCGHMLASNVLGLTPDIVTLSKGINSGYFPIGLTLFSTKVTKPFVQSAIKFQYGSTQDGNPVGCLTVLATLNLLRDGHLLERATTLGLYIKQNLLVLVGRTAVKEIRGIGLMIGIELSHLNGTTTKFTDHEVSQVVESCRKSGLIVYSFASGISLFPPLTLSDEDAIDIVEILIEVLQYLS